ncbi:hypothetical protein [Teichococcus aestuarii]|uniref:hypothetical protein n=1 Tax=Teichococcus aestuarii TaxID=568898 RepID=UPI00361450B6
MATSTASPPVAKLPRCPPRAATPEPSATGPPSWNTPERFSPTASISQPMPATKAGAVNWKPQPATPPAARSAIITPASARKESTTPAV